MKLSVAGVMLAVAGLSLSVFGETFFWKVCTADGKTAGAWADFGSSDNWDVGSVGGGNPSSIVPGAADAVDGHRAANWDLGGGECEIGTWNSLGDWGRYYFNLRNGTLTVNNRTSRNDTIVVQAGGHLVFPVGSTYVPSRECSGAEELKVLAGAACEIRGTFSPYRISMSTERNGWALVDPTSFRIDNGSAQTNVISIAGTNEFPHGLIWTGSGTAACSLTMTVTWSGRLLAAGDFSRNGQTGTFNFNLSGGYLETTGDLSFSGVDSACLTQASTLIVNEDHVLDVSNFSFYEGDAATWKSGAGALAVGANLPPTLNVSAGAIHVKAARTDLPGVKFPNKGIKLRYCVPGCRLDALEVPAQLSNVTLESAIPLEGLAGGVKLFSSTDDAIRATMKGLLETSVPEGFEIADDGDTLTLAKQGEIYFDATASSDLSDPTAWRNSGGGIPVGKEVSVKGAGTVVFGAAAPAFAKVTVTDGATLSIEGGTEGNPVVPPPLGLIYNGKIVIAGDAYAKLTNELDCTAMAGAVPVFEIATNATLEVDVPDHETKGVRFTNLHLNWFGLVKLPDAVNHSTPCITIGYAADGETAFCGATVDGGELEILDLTGTWQGEASQIAIFCPAAGGVVKSDDDLIWRNFVKGPEVVKVGNNEFRYANSGYSIGVNNPESETFTINVSGTPMCINGTSYFDGGAEIVATGADSGLVKGTNFWSYSLTQCVYVKGAAKITLKDGARFSNPWCVGNKGMIYFMPTDVGNPSLTLDGGVTEFYQLYGNLSGGARTARAVVKNGVYDIGRLMPESLQAPATGWVGAPYSPVFERFAQIEVQELLTVRGSDNFDRPAWWNFDGFWDHDVKLVDMPFLGAGSILVTNVCANNSMTLTVVNRGNQMTGEIWAAPGTRSYVKFLDDSRWVGTVVANGCASLTYPDANGDERPANVKFKDMRMESTFPIHCWKEGASATNDFITFSGSCTGEGGFVGEGMDGYRPRSGDTFAFALYPKSAALPRGGKGWSVFATDAGDGQNVILSLKCEKPGVVLIVR